MALREQDSQLVGQFLSLQTAIHLIRRNRSCPSLVALSHSSLSSSSWLSLDDGAFSAPGDTPIHQRDAMFELQQRTHDQVHMRQSSLDGSAHSPHALDEFYSRTQSLLNVTTSADRRPDFLFPRFDQMPRTCLNNNYSDAPLKLGGFQENCVTSAGEVPRVLLTPPCAEEVTPMNEHGLLPGERRVLCSLTDSDDSCDEQYDTLTKRPKCDARRNDDLNKDSITSDVYSLDVSTDSLDVPDVMTPRSTDAGGSVFARASTSSHERDDDVDSFEGDSLEDAEQSSDSDDVTLALSDPRPRPVPP